MSIRKFSQSMSRSVGSQKTRNNASTGDKQNNKASKIIEDVSEEVYMSFATYFQIYGGFQY